MTLFNRQMTAQSPVCKAVSKIRDSSLPIYSILWGFLIAGNNSQNTFHYMPQRQNKDLSQEMEPKYIPRHTLATSDHASDQHNASLMCLRTAENSRGMYLPMVW